MSRLLRAVVCMLIAVTLSSVSLAASAHAVVAVKEVVEHSQSRLDAMPCADCGSHRVRGCAQACSASIELPEPTAAGLAASGDMLHVPDRPVELHGLSSEPLLSPPIA